MGADRKITLNDEDLSTEIEVTAGQTVKDALLAMLAVQNTPAVALDSWTVQARVDGKVVNIDMNTALAGEFEDIIVRRKGG